MESRQRFAILSCGFWARSLSPFFLRDFWRFGSVNAEIASDRDCAILVRYEHLGLQLQHARDPQTYFSWRRSEGDTGKGTGQKMSWQSVPLAPVGFLLRAPCGLASFPFFSVLQRTFMGGAGTGLSWHFLTFFLPSPFGVPFWPSPIFITDIA